MNKNCVLCGTQSCVCHLGVIDEEAISHCGRYQGDILGIPKIKSILEELEEWMKENNFTWDAIRKEFNKKN
jgi:hypothetical protein